MKRWIALVLAVCMTASLCACWHTPTVPSTSTVPGVPETTGETQPMVTTQPTTIPLTETTAPSAVPTEPTEPVPTEPEPTEPTETEPTEPEPTEPEPTEPPEPEPESIDDNMLVKVRDFIPEITQSLPYATEENFTGKRVYDFTDAYLRYGTVKKLALVYEELAQQGIGLMIWDGFRPLTAQAMLWENCPDANYVSNPVTGNCSHCRGSAIDLTLVDLETGELLEMPTGFDDFTAMADRDYSDCTQTAAANAMLLQNTMEKYGFKSYYSEWWHYTDTTSYPIEAYFDPSMGMTWLATCNVSMSLRATASTSAAALAKIYPNDELTLIGWLDKFAKVSYNGRTGYVLTTYIKPAKEDYFESILDTVTFTEVYRYEQMMLDAQALADQYPDTVQLEIIATSELGRQIPVLRIGNAESTNHVLLHASTHGTEHATTWLLMAMVDYWLDHGLSGFGDVCWHIIPMVNPDGVEIAQTGILTDAQMAIYQQDLANGYTSLSAEEYAHQWKANGLGVDINRNFDAGWAGITHRGGPSYMLYAGEEPFSSAEAAMLRDYTQRYSFGATISYHTMGNVIYYQYGANASGNTGAKSLAKRIKQFTGYALAGSETVDAGGYKDWAIDVQGIPSVTVEIGSTIPVESGREMASIFARNYCIFSAVARWLQQ